MSMYQKLLLIFTIIIIKSNLVFAIFDYTNKFKHGSYINLAILKNIKKNKTTKKQVKNILNMYTDHDLSNNQWVYIGNIISRNIIFNNSEAGQSVILITFNNQNIVKEIQIFDEANKISLPYIRVMPKKYDYYKYNKYAELYRDNIAKQLKK